MSPMPYFFISGIIFGIVALLHFFRAINHWQFQIGIWMIPAWVSWVAGVVAAGLGIWAFRLGSQQGEKASTD